MTTLIEGRHPASFVLSELDRNGSRDTLVVAKSQTLVPGQVLGRRVVPASATASVAAAPGNVGDGALTVDALAPIRGDAEPGVYQVEVLTAGATAAFQVTNPRGLIVGTGAVGTVFAGPIKFAIADDPAHHYAVGDRLLVSVTIGTYEYAALDPAASDGLQVAAAIALYGVTTSSTAQGAVSGLTRVSEVNGAILTWPAGLSAPTLAAGIAALARAFIIVR